MRQIPAKMRDAMACDPYYKKCCRQADGRCDGRITWEHALLYAGKQVNEEFAIIPLCVRHHLAEGLDKKRNIQIALSRATEAQLAKYPKNTWRQQAQYSYGFDQS